MSKTRILFVCLGNICRSPMAEGAFRHYVTQAGLDDNYEIGSAGTGGWHIGNPPDQRAQGAALARGIDISQQKAQRITAADFSRYDLLIAMDEDNYHDLKALAPDGLDHKVRLFLDYAPELGEREVPDPYYGGSQGFEHVLDLVERASKGLLAQTQK